MIPLAIPNLAGNEQRYVLECIETNFVSSVGPFVERFEHELAEKIGVAHAVACASGTAALHVALRLCGVEAGDEVIAPTFTFIATVNPIAYQGARPVLLDAESRTWCIDPELVVGELETRAKEGRRLPKAVVVVHVLGHPVDIEPIVDVCTRYEIPLIEDAAGALGATYAKGRYAGRHVGTIGDFGCFSFNGNKIITTGGGGMLVTGDEALARRAKHLTTQARPDSREYMHDEVGYNYRLTNVAAALGVAQLELLDRFVAAKRRIAASYDEAFADVEGLSAAPRTSWAAPTFWLYTMLIDEARLGIDRVALQDELAKRGVMARPLWVPVHRMAIYAEANSVAPRAVGEQVNASAITLPCSTQLTDNEQEIVIEAVRGAIAR